MVPPPGSRRPRRGSDAAAILRRPRRAAPGPEHVPVGAVPHAVGVPEGRPGPVGRSSSAGSSGSDWRWRRTAADRVKPGARSSGPRVGRPARRSRSSGPDGPTRQVPQRRARSTGSASGAHRWRRPGPGRRPGRGAGRGCPAAATPLRAARPGGPASGAGGGRCGARPGSRWPSRRRGATSRPTVGSGPVGSPPGGRGVRAVARPAGSGRRRRWTASPDATIRLSATRARFGLIPNRPARCTRWATGSSGGSSPSSALARTDRAVSGARSPRAGGPRRSALRYCTS